MSIALESLVRIDLDEDDNPNSVLRLKPYQINSETSQVGMNGVVEPRLTAVNFSERVIETPVSASDQHKELVATGQLELPGLETRWAKFFRFFNSPELADWSVENGISHPGQLHMVENVAKLPPSLATHLVTHHHPLRK